MKNPDHAERLVMLPPYVAEEHRQLIDDAEKALEEYSELLLVRIKKELDSFKYGHSSTPESMDMAQECFLNDPVRQQMIRNLGELKMLVERPRFIMRSAGYSQP